MRYLQNSWHFWLLTHRTVHKSVPEGEGHGSKWRLCVAAGLVRRQLAVPQSGASGPGGEATWQRQWCQL